MKSTGRAAWLFLALAILAAAFRLPHLADRPMHADEAVHADKLGTLLEKGSYEYSTADYHGPTLYYVTLVFARLQGIGRYADLTEITLRTVPALFGIFLVAAHYFLSPYLGIPAAAGAALLTAVSPAMVYYSRYFIHETLFVAFTFGFLLAIFAWYRQRTTSSAVATGVLFGLMFATKETVVLPAACVLVAGLLQGKIERPSGSVMLVASMMTLAVIVVLMSSFFTHPRGIVDSVLAYRTYLHRGAGEATVHVYPWNFYFERLFYFREKGGPLFTEAFIGMLALVGFATAWMQPGIPRFLAVYAALMVAIHCVLPYKAPWNLLAFLHALILLAGMGGAWLVKRVPAPGAMLGLLLLGVGHLGWEARAASFPYAADPRNPWVYAHTGPDVFTIMKQVDAVAAADPAKKAAHIQVFTQENLWPLPWYLRRYSNVHWWNGVSDETPLAGIVLASPNMEPALLHRIYEVPPPGHRELYMNLFDREMDLRPRVEVRGYVAKSLWDQWQEAR